MNPCETIGRDNNETSAWLESEFKDGNKRTTWMIQTVGLFNDNVIPLLFFKENVKGYISMVLNYNVLDNNKDYSVYFSEYYKTMFELKSGISLQPEALSKKSPRMRM